jgi:hypothetical protein
VRLPAAAPAAPASGSRTRAHTHACARGVQVRAPRPHAAGLPALLGLDGLQPLGARHECSPALLPVGPETRARTHARMHACTQAHTQSAHMHAHAHTHTHTHTHIHTQAHTQTAREAGRQGGREAAYTHARAHAHRRAVSVACASAGLAIPCHCGGIPVAFARRHGCAPSQGAALWPWARCCPRSRSGIST